MPASNNVKPECGGKVETALQYCYFLSVSFAPLGPVVHYSLWALCALLLIAGCCVKREFLRLPFLLKDGRRFCLCLTIWSFWTVVAGLFTFKDILTYGHNVTVPLEVWFGVYLALRTLRDEKSRKIFLRIFAVGSLVILAGNFARIVGFISYFPNRSLLQSNSMGALGLQLFPPLACFAFWSWSDSFLKKFVFTLPVVAITVLSFSAGAWASAGLAVLVFAFYGFKHKKITLWFCLGALTLFCVFGFAFNRATHGSFEKYMTRELQQIFAVHDFDKLTTYRNQIWRVALDVIGQRPVTGWGGEKFLEKYKEVLNDEHKRAEMKLEKRIWGNHPHSIYLYLAYIGGLPGLFFFLAAMFFCLKRSLRLAWREKDVTFPWALCTLIMAVVLLSYGTNGDVLQGRRDVSVVVWCFLGAFALLPEPAGTKGEHDACLPSR